MLWRPLKRERSAEIGRDLGEIAGEKFKILERVRDGVLNRGNEGEALDLEVGCVLVFFFFFAANCLCSLNVLLPPCRSTVTFDAIYDSFKKCSKSNGELKIDIVIVKI